MKPPASLTSSDIDALMAGETIGDAHPWNTGNPDLIEGHYKLVCAAVERTCRAKSRIEWNHYGSGYASFVDACFYRPEAAFAPAHPTDYENEYVGLVVLLSRLSPFYALAEGEKGWSSTRGHSYMPCLDAIDRLTVPSVKELEKSCSAILESHGLQRLHAEALSHPMPPGTRIATNLSDRAHTYFDALFHWDD
jgi:hypothetical protein